jgi:hypothetical protein
MELITGIAERYRRIVKRPWSAKLVLLVMAWGAMFAGVVFLALAPAERLHRTARAICDDAVTHAMTADTLLEFERARFVVEGMQCSRSRRIRELHPVARAMRGE